MIYCLKRNKGTLKKLSEIDKKNGNRNDTLPKSQKSQKMNLKKLFFNFFRLAIGISFILLSLFLKMVFYEILGVVIFIIGAIFTLYWIIILKKRPKTKFQMKLELIFGNTALLCNLLVRIFLFWNILFIFILHNGNYDPLSILMGSSGIIFTITGAWAVIEFNLRIKTQINQDLDREEIPLSKNNCRNSIIGTIFIGLESLYLLVFFVFFWS